MITILKTDKGYAVKIGNKFNKRLSIDEALFVVAKYLIANEIHHWLDEESNWDV